MSTRDLKNALPYGRGSEGSVEMKDATTRFSSRVENYVRCRPSYPAEVWDVLVDALGLHAGSIVADVGSGTGISARLFLERGCTVYGIEPNAAMRTAGEQELAAFPQFFSRNGAAEATGLPEACVNLVTAAQAFHWFDAVAARTEFIRITREPHRCALIWNTRRMDGTPFLRDYEAFLQCYGTDYAQVQQRTVDPARLDTFFTGGFEVHRLDNEQRFDLDGLRGRVLSSSYVPGPEHPQYGAMMSALEELFAQHQNDGVVTFEYDTEISIGRLKETHG